MKTEIKNSKFSWKICSKNTLKTQIFLIAFLMGQKSWFPWDWNFPQKVTLKCIKRALKWVFIIKNSLSGTI